MGCTLPGPTTTNAPDRAAGAIVRQSSKSGVLSYPPPRLHLRARRHRRSLHIRAFRARSPHRGRSSRSTPSAVARRRMRPQRSCSTPAEGRARPAAPVYWHGCGGTCARARRAVGTAGAQGNAVKDPGAGLADPAVAPIRSRTSSLMLGAAQPEQGDMASTTSCSSRTSICAASVPAAGWRINTSDGAGRYCGTPTVDEGRGPSGRRHLGGATSSRRLDAIRISADPAFARRTRPRTACRNQASVRRDHTVSARRAQRHYRPVRRRDLLPNASRPSDVADHGRRGQCRQ